MNKFIDEGVKEGYEFIVIEPQDCYNKAIVAFDDGHLVYDVEKLMNCTRKYYDWDYATAIEWFEYNTLALTYMSSGPLFFEEDEKFYLTQDEKCVTIKIRNKIMEDK